MDCIDQILTNIIDTKDATKRQEKLKKAYQIVKRTYNTTLKESPENIEVYRRDNEDFYVFKYHNLAFQVKKHQKKDRCEMTIYSEKANTDYTIMKYNGEYSGKLRRRE